MKRWIALLLALCLLAALSACSLELPKSDGSENAAQPGSADEQSSDGTEKSADAQEPEDSSGENAAENSADGQQAEPDGNSPAVVTVQLSRSGETVEEDGVQFLHYALYSANVTVAGDAQASEKITGAIAAYNNTFAAGKDADVEMARETYQMYTDTNNWVPFARERSCDVLCNEGTVLSLRFSDYYNYGGAHPSVLLSTKNYDVSTGNELTLADIMENVDSFMAFAIDYVAEQAANREDLAPALFTDYQQSISSFVADGSWYFGTDGLVFICNAATIAPYAAGPLEFTIPYTRLDGMLKPAYVPHDVRSAAGVTPEISLKEACSRSESPELKAVVDTDGEHVCIWFSGDAADVRVRGVVAYGEEALVYEP